MYTGDGSLGLLLENVPDIFYTRNFFLFTVLVCGLLWADEKLYAGEFPLRFISEKSADFAKKIAHCFWRIHPLVASHPSAALQKFSVFSVLFSQFGGRTS